MILIVCIPMIVSASKKSRKYDSKGRAIITANEKNITDLEPGTPVVLAVPINTTKNNEEDRIAEKNTFANQINNQVATYSIKENDDNFIEFNNISEEQEKNDEEFLNILKKYYGNEKTENLINEIENETDQITSVGPYKFPEKGKELLKVIIDLNGRSEVSKEEKNILKEFAQSLNLATLNDKELVKQIENL